MQVFKVRVSHEVPFCVAFAFGLGHNFKRSYWLSWQNRSWIIYSFISFEYPCNDWCRDTEKTSSSPDSDFPDHMEMKSNAVSSWYTENL